MRQADRALLRRSHTSLGGVDDSSLAVLPTGVEGAIPNKKLALCAILAGFALVFLSSSMVGDNAMRRYGISYGTPTLMLLVLYGALMSIYLRFRGRVSMVEAQ